MWLDTAPKITYNAGSFGQGGFISPPFPEAQVAQLVEQRTENPRVGGSIPPLGTIPPSQAIAANLKNSIKSYC